MKTDEIEKSEYQVIPECVIMNWDAHGYVVDFVDKTDDAVCEANVDEVFNISAVSDSSFVDFEFGNPLFDDELVDTVNEFVKTEPDEEEIFTYLLRHLVLLEFFANPYSQGCISSSLLLEDIRFNTEKKPEELDPVIKRKLDEDIRESDLIRLWKESELAIPYIMDLSMTRLEAPDGVDFMLGESPMFLFNLLDRDTVFDVFLPFGYTGTILFMPVSPKYAVCLYDRKAYSLDSQVLSISDVEKYNAVILSTGSFPLIHDVEKQAPYYGHSRELSGSEPSVEDFSLSVFSLRNGVTPGDCDYRYYVRHVMDYDRKYLIEKEDIFDELSMNQRLSDTNQFYFDYMLGRVNRGGARTLDDGGEKTGGEEE
jgi:hypothetical protein